MTSSESEVKLKLNPCTCGRSAMLGLIYLNPKKPRPQDCRYSVSCNGLGQRPSCGKEIRGFYTEEQAVSAWNNRTERQEG